MTIFTILLLTLLVLFACLGVVLVVMFVRLSRELSRLGDTSEALAVKLQRSAKTVRTVMPTISLVQKAIHLYQKRKDANAKKGTHEKAAKKR